MHCPCMSGIAFHEKTSSHASPPVYPWPSWPGKQSLHDHVSRLAHQCLLIPCACTAVITLHEHHMRGYKDRLPHLLVLGHPAQEHKHAIATQAGLVASLVHARMLLLPLAEWVGNEPLACHLWLPLVASGKADTTDVQLALLACIQSVSVNQSLSLSAAWKAHAGYNRHPQPPAWLADPRFIAVSSQGSCLKPSCHLA